MSRPFRILSLDGGGIRGVFTAAFLAEIEKHLDHPIASYFDLIAGTSTGGIIALALGTGRSAAAIEEMYCTRAGDIFSPREESRDVDPHWRLFRLLRRLLRRRMPFDLGSVDRSKFEGLFRAKYQADGLARALDDEFGDLVLEKANRRLVVPAADMLDGKTVVFKTPHLPDLTRDRYRQVRDLALATSAAPTYFPTHAIERGHAYVDGGLWANNPAMLAYAEAAKISQVLLTTGRPRVFDIRRPDALHRYRCTALRRNARPRFWPRLVGTPFARHLDDRPVPRHSLSSELRHGRQLRPLQLRAGQRALGIGRDQ